MRLAPEERQAFARQVDSILKSEDPNKLRAALKRTLVLVWGNLSSRDRDEFMVRLDLEDGWAFVPPKEVSASALLDERLVSALDRWPDVMAGLSGKDREFAMDVNKRRHWKNWKPSEKQQNWILRLWHGHLTAPKDGEVVE